MLIKDWMTKEPVVAKAGTSIMKAAKLMKENKIRRLPVVDDDGRLVGMLSDRDIKEASPSKATTLDMHELYYLLSEIKVADIMTKKPLAITPDEPVERAAVVINGMGILGQHAVRSLRALGSKARIVAVARHGFQAEAAKAGGADVVLRSPSRQALGEAVGATFTPTTLGGGNLEGGADLFLDCAGGARAFQEGLLALRAGGTYVMVGTTARLSGADVSSLWFRQLTAVGSASYGHATDPRTGKRARTYEVALELLASGSYPVQGLLTHTFRLDDYARAFTAAFDKRGHASMKVAFDLRP